MLLVERKHDCVRFSNIKNHDWDSEWYYNFWALAFKYEDVNCYLNKSGCSESNKLAQLLIYKIQLIIEKYPIKLNFEFFLIAWSFFKWEDEKAHELNEEQARENEFYQSRRNLKIKVQVTKL